MNHEEQTTTMHGRHYATPPTKDALAPQHCVRRDARLGDVVWCLPNAKHWHDATTTTAMTHIAMQEALDGKVVAWMNRSVTHNTRPDHRQSTRKHASNTQDRRRCTTGLG
jgi:hypothetical protein